MGRHPSRRNYLATCRTPAFSSTSVYPADPSPICLPPRMASRSLFSSFLDSFGSCRRTSSAAWPNPTRVRWQAPRGTCLKWSGNEAVTVTWPNLVVLVGPFGDTLQYFYCGSTFAVTEPDGIRIVSPDTCDVVQKVPASSVSVFRSGSTSPSAFLFDAWENFSRWSLKADESIRSICPELAEAVDECIDAAAREWEPFWQRRLLNVHSALCPPDVPDFVLRSSTPCASTRSASRSPICNTRSSRPRTSSPVSWRGTSTPSRSASRPTSLCRPDAVLKLWACTKILRSKPQTTGTGKNADLESGDEALSWVIVEKFETLGRGSSGVSYADIAKRAWEVGGRCWRRSCWTTR
ncbi:Vps16, N-terminal region-domain-containing protein [Dichomitus squalens]|nr:Vps16, N-terminal region-domain-containing protein [Dichomitus squalens]